MTVALVANIARPISSAISTAFSADSYGLLSSYGLLGASASPDAVIEALFANSEQGAWYDPSDLTTMFQDRAGTTPVTADGQTVGLILDKSKGLVLGPELVENGDFNDGATGWALSAGASVSGGVLTLQTTGATDATADELSIATEIGKTYKLVVNVLNRTVASGFLIRVYNTLVEGTVIASYTGTGTGPVTATLIFTAIGTASPFRIYNHYDGAAVVTIESVTLKELPGNHAVAPSDAARPLYKTDGTYHWLKFDGVDDSLSTAAFAWGTNKSTASVGITNNNTSTGVPFTFGPNPVVDNGSFGSYTRVSANGDYSIAARGTVQSYWITASGSIPRTDVVTLTYDLSQIDDKDSLKMRLNGSSATLSFVGGGDLGGGTFATHSIYIGKRGDGSLPFLGNIYSLIIRGALSTTQEITDTETWVNSKTGAWA